MSFPTGLNHMAVHEVILRHYIKDGTIEIDITDLVNELTRDDAVSQIRTQVLLGIKPEAQPMTVMVSLKFEPTTELEALFL
jgi:hypothetical protein